MHGQPHNRINRYEIVTENNSSNGRCGAKGLLACAVGRQTCGESCSVGDPHVSVKSKCYGLLVLTTIAPLELSIVN